MCCMVAFFPGIVNVDRQSTLATATDKTRVVTCCVQTEKAEEGLLLVALLDYAAR